VVGDQRHVPFALPPEKKNTVSTYTRLWGPRASLDGCENFVPASIRSSHRQARREPLYRLSYPAARVCVSNLSYLVCKGQVLYCHLWSASLHHLFPHKLKLHVLISGTIFGEKAIEHKMCVLILSTNYI